MARGKDDDFPVDGVHPDMSRVTGVTTEAVLKALKAVGLFGAKNGKSPLSDEIETEARTTASTTGWRTSNPAVDARWHTPSALRGKTDLGWGGNSLDNLVEVLHLANYDRDRFGYSRHVAYQDHILSVARTWNHAKHTELVGQVEPKLAGARADMLAVDEAGTFNVAAYEQEVAEQVARAERRQKLAKEEHAKEALERALKHSDASDALPDGLGDLIEGAVLPANAGSW